MGRGVFVVFVWSNQTAPAFDNCTMIAAFLASLGIVVAALVMAETVVASEPSFKGFAAMATTSCREDPSSVPVPLDVTIMRLPPSGPAGRIVVRFSKSNDQPLAEWRFDQTCSPQVARAVLFDERGILSNLIHLDPITGDETDREFLNPAVPDGVEVAGVRVGHIDSGAAYTLPLYMGRLARDDDGALVGYDYWDEDARPFDLDVGTSPFQPFRHGTTVSSILLNEAPSASLVLIRYPRPDMSRMADAVEYLKAAGVRIVLMPLGSDRADLWTAFEAAVRVHPDMLFIVSAGNDGRDIDVDPVYPAALDVPNMIVVTSADDFGRLATGSNWGARSVDLMVPGEGVDVTDHRGAAGKASGSSFAAPRVAALAARILEANPSITMSALIQAIKDRARRPLVRGGAPVQWGWIPDPADDF